MLTNIIKVAFRNLFKYPGYSLLNMGGLALGLASSFLLLLYAQRELTVDRHFQNADRIHRIATDFFNMGGFAVSQEVLHEYLITECKDMDQEKTIQTFPVDENYITALGMQLIAGRNFSRQMDSDTTAAIINETAARELGLHAPLDAEINPGMRVIGVVRDFHYESLRNGITPVVLRYSPHGGSLAVKLKGADLSAFINELQAIWKGFSPDAPLHYSFLDESFAQLLEKEKILGRAVAFFTLLAIIISCLGLFALAVFTAESRTKEIGIRKVLGAGIGRIVALAFARFHQIGARGRLPGTAHSLAGDEPLAGRFCLSDRNPMVDAGTALHDSPGSRASHCELTSGKGGNGRPG
jgi:ABC-type antimicrobial peptide transport system permease subunit